MNAPTPPGDDCVVAGHLVVVPEPLERDASLPPVPVLLTVSDCLADRLPHEGAWFGSRAEALAACAELPCPAETRVLTLLVPASAAPRLAAEVRAAQVEDDQVLADNLTAPQPLAAGTAPAGWEVLGYDLGLLHSWLCNDLYRDAVTELAVAAGERGLLRERAEAEAVAAWANARTDTKPVTWFAAAVVEWSDRVGRPTTEPPPPADRDRRRPWWRRATGR